MNKPKIRFKGYTDAWERRKLGEIAEITMGQSPNGNTYFDFPCGYILVQGNADLKDGWVFPRIWTTQKTKIADAGDLIMSVRAPAGAMGKTAYRVVLGRGVAGIKGNEFLFQILSKLDADGYWKKLSCGSTFESLNSNNINEASVNVSSSQSEQAKIGAFFRGLDELIALHQRKYEKLQKVKKSFLEKMFPTEGESKPRIRFKGYTDAWERRKLGECGETQSGIGFPESEQGGKEGIPFFKVSDMNNVGNEIKMQGANNYVSAAQITRKGWKPIASLPAIMFAKVGAAIMLNRKRLIEIPFLIDNNTMVYIFDRSWDSGFGRVLFETIALPRYAQVGALPSYNGSDIENITIKLPHSQSEQAKIGAFFRGLDELIALHQRKLDKLKNIKKSFLEKMFPAE